MIIQVFLDAVLELDDGDGSVKTERFSDLNEVGSAPAAEAAREVGAVAVSYELAR